VEESIPIEDSAKAAQLIEEKAEVWAEFSDRMKRDNIKSLKKEITDLEKVIERKKKQLQALEEKRNASNLRVSKQA
jgi:transcription initiation factor IIF auxiliary subunit